MLQTYSHYELFDILNRVYNTQGDKVLLLTKELEVIQNG